MKPERTTTRSDDTVRVGRVTSKIAKEKRREVESLCRANKKENLSNGGGDCSSQPGERRSCASCGRPSQGSGSGSCWRSRNRSGNYWIKTWTPPRARKVQSRAIGSSSQPS